MPINDKRDLGSHAQQKSISFSQFMNKLHAEKKLDRMVSN